MTALTLAMAAAILILSFYVYFLPSVIASKRSHSNTTAIFVLNFFLGWTFAGWVVALVWAYTKDNSQTPSSDKKNTMQDKQVWYRKCPYCAEEIFAEAIKCRYCNEEITAVKTPELQ